MARQYRYLRTHLAFGETQFVILLQIHPELRTGAKPVPKTQRRICRYAALAVDDPRDPVHRYVNLTRKLGRADAKFAQFFGQMFAGVDGCTRHDGLPSMIVDDLYLDRPLSAVRPRKADTPLVVYPN
jgi:hypothetical protein